MNFITYAMAVSDLVYYLKNGSIDDRYPSKHTSPYKVKSVWVGLTHFIFMRDTVLMIHVTTEKHDQISLIISC